LKTIWSWLWRSVLVFIGSFALSLLLLRWIPPAYTPLMVWRMVQAPFTGYSGGIAYNWVPLESISPWMVRGAIASEDRAFANHEGVDWRAVEHARKVNPGRVKRGKPPLGASTITMQTARSVYLVPSRSMARKALEVGIAFAIERTWGKRRIMEMYLNVAEWGDGIYGVEAAARHYFGKHAKELTRAEAARLIAVLPNPRRFDAANPSPYIKRRAAAISAGMGGAVLPREDVAPVQPPKSRRARKK
jgi:monofunctional biosynthetic peptidoglycan transglycosylase